MCLVTAIVCLALLPQLCTSRTASDTLQPVSLTAAVRLPLPSSRLVPGGPQKASASQVQHVHIAHAQGVLLGGSSISAF